MTIAIVDTGYWVDQIKHKATKSVLAIVDLGKTLIDCKEALPHGDFEQAVEQAGMSTSAARKLMSIARNPVISNQSHANDLPVSTETLSILARLEPEALEAGIQEGTIGPGLARSDAKVMVTRTNGKRDRAELASNRESHWETAFADFGGLAEIEELRRLKDATPSEFQKAVFDAGMDGDPHRDNVVRHLEAIVASRPPPAVSYLRESSDWSDAPLDATFKCENCERYLFGPGELDADGELSCPECGDGYEVVVIEEVVTQAFSDWVMNLEFEVDTPLPLIAATRILVPDRYALVERLDKVAKYIQELVGFLDCDAT